MITNKIIYNIAKIIRLAGFDFHEEKNKQVIEMQNKLQELGGFQFEIEFHPDGSWSAESTNIDGVITGGKSIKEVNSAIKDAVFTYFSIPPYFCNDNLVKADNEPVTVMQKIYA